MAEGSSQLLKKKSSSPRKTGSIPIAGQSRPAIQSAKILEDVGDGGLVRQTSNPFLQSLKSPKKQNNNPHLGSSEVVQHASKSAVVESGAADGDVLALANSAREKAAVAADVLSLTNSARANAAAAEDVLSLTNSARATAAVAGEALSLTSSAREKAATAGDVLSLTEAGDVLSLTNSAREKAATAGDVLSLTNSALAKEGAAEGILSRTNSTDSKALTQTASVRTNQSSLLARVPSKIQDAIPSTGISAAPSLELDVDKLASGTISAKPPSPGQSISGRSSHTKVRSSFTNAHQSNQSLIRSRPNSVKSNQPSLLRQAAFLHEKTSPNDKTSVLSDKTRKLTRASGVRKQYLWGSKQSVFSHAEKVKQAPRDSTWSEITRQQTAGNELALRSSKSPGIKSTNSMYTVNTTKKDRSVLGPDFRPTPSSQSTSSTTKTTGSNKLEDNIRLLESKLSTSTRVGSGFEIDLQTRMRMCPCPDVNAENDYEDEEDGEQLESIRSMMRSEQKPQQYKRAIRNVKRSPFERKDRAARQEFLKELEHMEISEIEKKQKLKPRRIKPFQKKEGVYQTIKDANLIPDSHTGTSPRHSTTWSVVTCGENEQAQASSSSPEVTPEESESSDRIDKIQLRGHQSIGSRAAGLPLLREEAFLEIELSEAEDVEPTPRSSFSLPSSSATEYLSSSSDISLRVNLEKKHLPAEKRKIKARNAPFVAYKDKVDKEIEAGTNKSIHDATQENLIIEKIATEFGEWAKENGLKPEAVEKDIIKELFQFGTMDTAANSIAVEIKELIIVPETITEGLYPELEERAALYRQILWDEVAYWKKERSMAFGKPDPFPYKRPPHQPLPLWTKSGFVPLPLSTGELLYQSLIDNESLMLERYVLWMVENPKYHRPPYLIKSGYFQKIIEKHGGSEDIIRQKSHATKHMVNSTGKSLAGLNIGMKTELRKLKEMAKADVNFYSNKK